MVVPDVWTMVADPGAEYLDGEIQRETTRVTQQAPKTRLGLCQNRVHPASHVRKVSSLGAPPPSQELADGQLSNFEGKVLGQL